MDRQQHPLESLLDEAIKCAKDGKLSVGDLLSAYGTRGFGPVIATLALITILIGAIPFLPMVIAAVILLMSVQLLFGKKQPWVPGAIAQRSIDVDHAKNVRDKSAKWLRRVDRLVKPRLEWAAGGVAQWFSAFCVSALALVMGAPPLEAIPFAVDVPALPILIFGIGLTARDGLFMLVGFALSAIAAYLCWLWLSQPDGGSESASLVISMVA
ncbi:exopolysaccharide biosynthesis protein [Pacificimonas sp. ICDLI1SI03]